ncbi:MAG: oxidoreductase [Spirochaetes bacterium RIFOXYC1_FULL_54_7]|nr:MAG: oxidoreductase [Spirochaetes bacterium RIFOXYC1_FULL_54_7]
MSTTTQGSVPKRLYKDGIQLSIIGFGGILVCSEDQTCGNRYVSESIDRGVNYFDVAPSYFDGEAELKLGIALEPYRNKVFLACKTGKRDAAGAQAELELSLERLRTDHFDLYQFHAVTTMEEVDQILSPKGAAETFLRARDAGLVRYLGFSAHSVVAALALMDAFPVDSVLFPLNFVMVSQGNFGTQILERAKQSGAARMALKAMATTPWADGEAHTYQKAWYKPAESAELRRKALRYTLSQDICAAIPPGHYELYKEALDTASSFVPMDNAEQQTLMDEAAGLSPLFNHPA